MMYGKVKTKMGKALSVLLICMLVTSTLPAQALFANENDSEQMTTSVDANPVAPVEPGDGAEPPVEPGDGAEPPVEPGDGAEPPIEPGDGAEPPIEPGDEAEPPIEPGDEAEPPVEPGDEAEPPVEPGDEAEPPVEPGDEAEPPIEEKPPLVLEEEEAFVQPFTMLAAVRASAGTYYSDWGMGTAVEVLYGGDYQAGDGNKIETICTAGAFLMGGSDHYIFRATPADGYIIDWEYAVQWKHNQYADEWVDNRTPIVVDDTTNELKMVRIGRGDVFNKLYYTATANFQRVGLDITFDAGENSFTNNEEQQAFFLREDQIEAKKAEMTAQLQEIKDKTFLQWERTDQGGAITFTAIYADNKAETYTFKAGTGALFATEEGSTVTEITAEIAPNKLVSEKERYASQLNPPSGYEFAGWLEDGKIFTATYSEIAVYGEKVHFTKHGFGQDHSIKVLMAGDFENVADNSITNLSTPGVFPMGSGAQFQFQANVAEGYEVHWEYSIVHKMPGGDINYTDQSGELTGIPGVVLTGDNNEILTMNRISVGTAGIGNGNTFRIHYTATAVYSKISDNTVKFLPGEGTFTGQDGSNPKEHTGVTVAKIDGLKKQYAQELTPPENSTFVAWELTQATGNVIEYTAQYARSSYVITFDPGEGSFKADGKTPITVTKAKDQVIGDAPRVEAPATKNLANWIVTIGPEDSVGNVLGDQTKAVADVTYTAQYSAKPTCEISFYADQHGYFDNDDENIFYTITAIIGEPIAKEGDHVDKMVTARPGYEWTGWSPDFDFAALAPEGGQVYTATYKKIYQTVTFDAGAGSIAEDGKSTNTEINEIVSSDNNTVQFKNLKDNAFAGIAPTVTTPKDQVFLAWQDATGKTFDPATLVATDTAYTAVYTDKPVYQITFDAVDGRFGNGEQTVVQNVIAGYAIGEAPSVPNAPKGQEFVQWLDANGVPFASDTVPTSAMTYKAEYQDVYFNITFDAGQGHFAENKNTLVAQKQKDDAFGQALAPTAPDGYKFVKWVDEAGQSYSESVLVTSAKTYAAEYAEMEKVTYAITFKAGSGYFGEEPTAKSETRIIVAGDTAGAAPKATAPENYRFNGWDPVYAENEPVMALATYTAVYVYVPPVDPTDPPVDPVDPTDPPVDPVDPTDPPAGPVDPPSGGGSDDVYIPESDVPLADVPEIDINENAVPLSAEVPIIEEEILANEVPLSGVPQLPQDNTEEVIIIDGETPLGNLPKTGGMAASIIGLAAMILLAGGLLFTRKPQDEN